MQHECKEDDVDHAFPFLNADMLALCACMFPLAQRPSQPQLVWVRSWRACLRVKSMPLVVDRLFQTGQSLRLLAEVFSCTSY